MQYTSAQGPNQVQSALVSIVSGKRPGESAVRIAGSFGFRFVGDLRGDALYKRVKPAHIFRAVNGVGFSAALIHSPEIHFRRIIANVEGMGKLETTREYFKARAIPIHMKRWEPQLVLPLDMWGRQKAEEWEAGEARRRRRENAKAAQAELFAA
jgi:hypothetical protein